MFQLNLLDSQGGNSREMTTSPPGHHWEVTVALTTTAKLQVWANSREMTSQKLNNRCGRSMRFCVASWLLSFQVPLGSLWSGPLSWVPPLTFRNWVFAPDIEVWNGEFWKMENAFYNVLHAQAEYQPPALALLLLHRVHLSPRQDGARMYMGWHNWQTPESGFPKCTDRWPLTRNCYENNSLRIIIRKSWGILQCTLKIYGKLGERCFQEITRELRNFSKLSF